MSENLDDLAKLDQKRAESIEQLTSLLSKKHLQEQVTEAELAAFGLESGFHDAVRQALSRVNGAKPNLFVSILTPISALFGEISTNLLKVLVFVSIFFVVSQRDYLDFLANKVIASEAIAAEGEREKKLELKAEVYRVFSKYGLLDKLKEEDAPALKAELATTNRWIEYRQGGIASLRGRFLKDPQVQQDTWFIYKKVWSDLTYFDPSGYKELRVGLPASPMVFLEASVWASLGLLLFTNLFCLFQSALKDSWRIHRLHSELKKIL